VKKINEGDLVAIGSVTNRELRREVRLQIGPSDGKDGIKFGCATELVVEQGLLRNPDGPYAAEVSLPGIQAHGTELGRDRAYGMLAACNIGDRLVTLINIGGLNPIEAMDDLKFKLTRRAGFVNDVALIEAQKVSVA
jgi:hypothetical protein